MHRKKKRDPRRESKTMTIYKKFVGHNGILTGLTTDPASNPDLVRVAKSEVKTRK